MNEFWRAREICRVHANGALGHELLAIGIGGVESTELASVFGVARALQADYLTQRRSEDM